MNCQMKELISSVKLAITDANLISLKTYSSGGFMLSPNDNVLYFGKSGIGIEVADPGFS